MQVQRLNIAQQQRLKLSPQMIQSIRIMTMPAIELRERIAEELEQNPALELVAPALIEQNNTEYTIEHGYNNSNLDNDSDGLYAGESDVSYGEYGKRTNSDASASDAHQLFLESLVSHNESLQEHLLSQLKELSLSEDIAFLASIIIQNLDNNGFHIVAPEELLHNNKTYNFTKNSIKKALYIVRRLEPLGVACANFQESLIFQAEYYKDAPELSISLLKNHIELLEKPRSDIIAKKLKIPQEKVEQALDFIRTLEPFPGRQYDSHVYSYIIPDVLIKKGEEGFVAVINEEEIPILKVSPVFLEVSKDTKQKSQARSFVKESIREAKSFIGLIKQRNQTLLKVVNMIVLFQEEFFLKGPRFLRSLRLQDIAIEIGVHEATVSRISNGKYIQCEWGIFEIKYFFSSAVQRKGSNSSTQKTGQQSREAVKQVLKEIIEKEGKLSDRELAERLNSQGISVARRTVAKYRTELTIASSFEREHK